MRLIWAMGVGMEDQRCAPRNRTYLRAEIDLNGVSSLACIVRDLNEVGARISLSEAIFVPERFRLRLPKPDRWVEVHVRWRRGDNIGVYFEAVILDDGGPGGDDAARIRQLEADNARLRRMLEDLRNDPSKLHQILDHAS